MIVRVLRVNPQPDSRGLTRYQLEQRALENLQAWSTRSAWAAQVAAIKTFELLPTLEIKETQA